MDGPYANFTIVIFTSSIFQNIPEIFDWRNHKDVPLLI